MHLLITLLLVVTATSARRRKRRRTWTGLRHKLYKNGKQICRNLNSVKLQELCSYRMLNPYCYHRFYNEDPLEIGQEDDFKRVEAFYACLVKFGV